MATTYSFALTSMMCRLSNIHALCNTLHPSSTQQYFPPGTLAHQVHQGPGLAMVGSHVHCWLSLHHRPAKIAISQAALRHLYSADFSTATTPLETCHELPARAVFNPISRNMCRAHWCRTHVVKCAALLKRLQDIGLADSSQAARALLAQQVGCLLVSCSLRLVQGPAQCQKRPRPEALPSDRDRNWYCTSPVAAESDP
jgi:hypothetical protein